VRSRRFGLAIACALAVAASAAPAAAQTPAPAPVDSLFRLLRALSDSTDARFGAATVEFDTTGLDTLVANALTLPATPTPRRLRVLYPVIGYHRTSGPVVGAGYRVGSLPAGFLDLRGSYAASAKLGRYAFGYRKTLWAPAGPLPIFQAARPGLIGRRDRLDLELRYAREFMPFMPEHADADAGGFGALLWGSGAQSVYERRGFSGGFALWRGDWRARAGVTDAREKALPIATYFSFFGHESDVAPNTPADADAFTEPYGELAFLRRDWELAGVVTVEGTGERRRLRGALGKAVRLGPNVKLSTQVEAGAAAAAAPRQRRFELGGALAVPSLGYGQGGTDHLLLTRVEMIGSPDVLKALHLPHPEWFILRPSVFLDYGNVWDDPACRDVVFSRPPAEDWRGAAGGGFAWRIGIPEPDVTMRMWMAWPLGPRAGAPQFNFTAGRGFELLGRL